MKNPYLKLAYLVPLISLLLIFIYPTTISAAAPTVTSGTTSTYAVLASSTVTNTGATTIGGTAGGNIGLSPGTSYTGGGTVTQSNGVNHINDAAAAQAQLDLGAAIISANTPAATSLPTADLAGQTILPGVYTTPSGAFSNSGTLTLDAQGDSAAVFIFRTASTLTTTPGSTISLIGSGQACNVYWSVASSATLGVNSTFIGHIYAQVSITANTGANIQGSLLARTGAVSLDTNTITNNVCTTPTPTPTPTPVSTPSATPTQGTSVFAPVPDLPQNGSISSVSTAVCSTTSGYKVLIDGVFASPLTNVSVSGSNIARSSWVQTPTQVTVTIPPTNKTKISIRLYNGRAPVMALQYFICTAPAVIIPTPVTTPTPIASPVVTPIAFGTLVVIKNVVNNNSGTATASDFTLRVIQSGADVAGSPAAGVSGLGMSYTLEPGIYVVLENSVAGYYGTFAATDPALGQFAENSGLVTVIAGQTTTITRTNYQVPPFTTPVPEVTPPVTQTETGGLLPKTATPWYNLLALGFAVIMLGATGFISRKKLQ